MAPQPNYAVPTGDFIAEWVDDNGINAAELSRRLGTSPKHVSELLSGKAPLSHDMAIKLEDVTGVPARVWNQYEALYREDLARLEADAKYEAQYEDAKAFPLIYLRKYGYITAAAKEKATTVKQLLELFGTADLRAWAVTWSSGNVAYRRSAVGRHDTPALATWLTLGEQQAHDLNVADYDETALRKLLPTLRGLSREDPAYYLVELPRRLAAVGVALVYLPEPPGLGTYGATRWQSGKPIVQLSLRQKTDDHLWFTLFHEIAHVLHDDRKGLYLATEDNDAEKRADRYAADTLIPPEYADRLPTRRDLQAVSRLADELGVAPGIVLGRVHRETGDYRWGHALKKKFHFEPQEAAS